MNVWLAISSALSFVLGIGHSLMGEWVGERVLVKRIQNIQLSEIEEKDITAKQVVRLAWHATSITWCGMGVLFLYTSFVELNHTLVIIRILSITFFFIGVFSLFTVPRKAVLFFLIALTSWIGTL